MGLRALRAQVASTRNEHGTETLPKLQEPLLEPTATKQAD
jgi:hypothetical protein